MQFQHREPLGDDTHPVGAVGGCTGEDIHIHTAAENAAVLMIGMVAAQFRSAGGAENCHIAHGRKGLFKQFHHACDAVFSPQQALLRAVQGIHLTEAVIIFPLAQGAKHPFAITHGDLSFPRSFFYSVS